MLPAIAKLMGSDGHVRARHCKLVALIAGLAALPVVVCAAAITPKGPAGAGGSSVVDVTSAQLATVPVTVNWLSYNGDYTGRRYSGLDQINASNVSQLAAQWIFHTRVTTRLEGTPEVVNGIMFVTAGNDCYALDAKTGRVIWHHHMPVTQGLIDDASSHHNRGVAIWHDRIYMETDNAHLLCLDARSGNLLWDVEYADTSKHNYGATSSPLVVKNDVLVGTSGGDDGVRGFVAAYDVRTGKQLWRFWTIPAPGEFGNSSWPGDMYLHGGGTTWMPGTYDPETNTIFWGTGNAAPDFDGAGRPGDDLYTDCVLALDPDNGKLMWYYQFTPHDLNDYDSVETPVLVDTNYHGSPRKLLVEANRNGFIYVLDRTDGKFLSARPFTDNVNWAKRINARGHPVKTGLVPTRDGTEICPSYGGATNWYAPTYSPQTHMFYFLGNNSCNVFFSKPQKYTYGTTYYATGVKRVMGGKVERMLLAYNPNSNSFAWEYRLAGGFGGAAGAMSTAGGLVFFGDTSDSLEAVNARTGRPLWHFNTGESITASPMTFAVRGRQYVAIAAGSDVVTFALPQKQQSAN
jgi:alcohol dehydrogenase (cytochrome c)